MTILECSCGLCRRLLAATIPVQHRTLPEDGYDAASYLVGYGGSGHGICIALHCIALHCIVIYLCHGSVFLRLFSIVLKFISGFGYLFI